jgi:hypothetical protein
MSLVLPLGLLCIYFEFDSKGEIVVYHYECKIIECMVLFVLVISLYVPVEGSRGIIFFHNFSALCGP